MPRHRAIPASDPPFRGGLGPGMISATKKANPIDIHVGQRMRARRQHLGMSQEKLANAIGLTFQQVQKYEKGMNRMGSSRLLQVADVLGVTPPYFFEGMTERAPRARDTAAENIAMFCRHTDAERLARAFMKLPLKVRRAVRWMVEEVADHAKAAS